MGEKAVMASDARSAHVAEKKAAATQRANNSDGGGAG